MGAQYFQEFGSRLFDVSSASGYMGATDFQEFGPRFVACHVPNVACLGVSISIVSISSMLCRVRILRVGVSMPCRGHPAAYHFEFFRLLYGMEEHCKVLVFSNY